jgi:serine/threonine protein kinase
MIDLIPGAQIGGYTLGRRLGSGAASEVWSATDTGWNSVAIKFLSGDTPKGRQHLENEIRSLERVHHAYVPTLLTYDLAAERPYLVMSYTGGAPYDRLLSTGEMLLVPLRSRLAQLSMVAEALAAVHRSGLVHRDVKLGNISGFDPPYLLDFGIAVERGSQPAERDMGTALYMPPENGPVDERYDTYSFALVTYEMLFGRHPLFANGDSGESVATIRQMAGDRLRAGTWRLPSRVLASECPGDLRGADMAALDRIFTRALGPLDGRYTDPREFVLDVESAVLVDANLPYADNPLPPADPTQRADERATNLTGRPRIRRERLLMLAAAGLSLLAFIIWGILALLWRG